MQILKTVFTFFVISSLQAQIVVPDKKSNLSVIRHSYSLLLNGEQHSSIKLGYDLGDNLKAELNTFYDTYLLENRLRTSVILKRYFFKKLYVFGGLNMELALLKNSNIISRQPRIGVLGGLGYEVKPNFNVEMQSNFGINRTTIGAYGESLISMPQVHTIKGKLKF